MDLETPEKNVNPMKYFFFLWILIIRNICDRDILMEEENEPPLPGGGGGANTAGRRERRANRQAAHLQPREREFAGL